MLTRGCRWRCTRCRLPESTSEQSRETTWARQSRAPLRQRPTRAASSAAPEPLGPSISTPPGAGRRRACSATLQYTVQEAQSTRCCSCCLHAAHDGTRQQPSGDAALWLDGNFWRDVSANAQLIAASRSGVRMQARSTDIHPQVDNGHEAGDISLKVPGGSASHSSGSSRRHCAAPRGTQACLTHPA